MKKSITITQLLAFVALFICLTPLHADVIKGRVVDAETKETLPEATVRIIQRTDYGSSIYTTKTDSLGVFFSFASGRASVEASMLGYYKKSKSVLAFSDSDKDTIDVGTIELKISPQMLKMVEVQGHARRFSVRGDTIVFHPEAFHLQEGARLDELISKLPGVEVDKEGKMTWNGKPIRLTMDGESMLGGDQLMKQLPAEAVQDIKAYNKASEFSERTKKDDGKEDMVLDLTIKPGFLDRWYGDVTAGYQSPRYYESELSMNRLSKSDPIMVYADANSIDKRVRKGMNSWSSSWGSGYGQEQGGTAGYQHKWQKKEGTQEMRSQYSFTGSLVHNDNWETRNTETDNYFPNAAASRSQNENYWRSHSLTPTINADLRWAKDSLNTYTLSASASHKKRRSHSTDTTEESEAASSSDTYAPILSQITKTHDEGYRTDLNTRAGWEHYVKEGSFGASLNINYTDNKEESETQRTITSHQEGIASSLLNQQYTEPSTSLNIYADVHRSHWITKKWMVQAQYSFTYNQNHSRQDFMTNGVEDNNNTYRNHRFNINHSLRIGQTINLTPLQLMPNVEASWIRTHLDYTRSSLDTTAVRRRLLVTPSLRATLKLTKTIGFEVNYRFDTSLPDLFQTIGYRDLTNPLNISEGNPNLKDSHSHDISLRYNMVLAKSQTNISATISHHTSDRNQVNALSYDPTTAVYTSRQENVKGSRSWEFRLNIDQALGDFVRLQNDFRLRDDRHYGFLTLLPTQAERTLTRQTDFHPRNKLTVSYDKDWLKSSVYAIIDADRIRYTASPEQNTTLWNNEYGLNVEATFGNFVFESDLSDETRRGYAMQSMNKNLLTWNGSITWKILKNKARLKMEFQDILNNQDGFYSNQTAYQRTTSWRDFRHHYVGISFTYHLDAKSKDK